MERNKPDAPDNVQEPLTRGSVKEAIPYDAIDIKL